jgi:hypothetical protein
MVWTGIGNPGNDNRSDRTMQSATTERGGKT